MENNMEKAKDLILYQVATDRHYKVGDKILFDGSIPNGQYERVFNSTFLKDNKRLSDTLYDATKRKFCKLKNDDIFEVAHALEYYDVITKELAIEGKNIFQNIHQDCIVCIYL